MTDEAPTPAAPPSAAPPAVVEVPESAMWGQLAVLGRDLMKCAGAGLFVDGVINHRTIQASVGVALSVAPIIYSQLKTWWTHTKLLFLAKSPRVPGDLARLK